jgi:hypothetical protein
LVGGLHQVRPVRLRLLVKARMRGAEALGCSRPRPGRRQQLGWQPGIQERDNPPLLDQLEL